MAYGSRGRILGGKGGATIKVEAERPNLPLQAKSRK